jgi:membrane associated rhomboid family serine protease
MSYYQQRNRNRLSIGQDGNALTMLIAIILVAFVLLAFIKVIYYFTYGPQGLAIYQNQILSWVSLPAFLPTFLTRPWTLITHFFVHDSVWHLIANLIWLWAFGHILQSLSGNSKIIPIFLYGAFAGAFMYMLSYNLIPALKEYLLVSTAIGASAGIMAIAIATTVMAPGYRIFPMLNGGIPLWVITMIFVIIDLLPYLIIIPEDILHTWQVQEWVLCLHFNGSVVHDWSTWINNFFEWVNNLFNPDKPKRAKVIKSQLFYKGNTPPYKKTSGITQQRIDDILDKINQKGYETLTQEEKDILKRASKEDL